MGASSRKIIFDKVLENKMKKGVKKEGLKQIMLDKDREVITMLATSTTIDSFCSLKLAPSFLHPPVLLKILYFPWDEDVSRMCRSSDIIMSRYSAMVGTERQWIGSMLIFIILNV